MTSIQIYKDKFFNAIINGAKAVILKEKQLNEINVFPVKDADSSKSRNESDIKRNIRIHI
jgi:dihydroxyacetone kinase-like predicted kinase